MKKVGLILAVCLLIASCSNYETQTSDEILTEAWELNKKIGGQEDVIEAILQFKLDSMALFNSNQSVISETVDIESIEFDTLRVEVLIFSGDTLMGTISIDE